jgi:Flp pilus assembly pilin Flp
MLLALPRNEGQGLVEYALLVSFLVLVLIVVFAMFGPQVGNAFSNIVQSI